MSALTGGERLKRGFSRTGIVLAVPLAAIGIGVSLWQGIENASDKQARFQQMTCIRSRVFNDIELRRHPNPERVKIDMREICSGPASSEMYSNILLFDETKTPSWFLEFAPFGLGGSAVAILSGMFVFGVVYVFGWMLAGFTKDAA
jgi:hypothetical protein